MNLLDFLAIGIALGLALGLFGGGGGILAIPLLVAAGLPADEAGTTSLIVVGIGAIGGLIPHARAGRVAWAQGATFGALGIIGALAGSTLALATNDAVQLWGFSVVLVVAGTLMMRKRPADPPSANRPEPDRHRQSWALIVVTAAAGHATRLNATPTAVCSAGGWHRLRRPEPSRGRPRPWCHMCDLLAWWWPWTQIPLGVPLRATSQAS